MAKLIGTAGHVDHGKTSLILALTGIDADRLPEEKARGLTIDIGFAYVDLPGIGRASIVDVPGHERFLTNMLVGAMGIDVALLCVAADESVKPQTVEHLQILELLPVESLVVAMTKCDLVDSLQLQKSTSEVKEMVDGTRFRGAQLMAVSSISGAGLEELKSHMSQLLTKDNDSSDKPWYIPIDRVFTVKGHGTVITGTLSQGEVHEGSDAQIQPGNLRGRIRHLQGHSHDIPKSVRGQRTALNIAGIKKEDVSRGMVAGAPGTVFETGLFEAAVEWIETPRHGQRVRVAVGADEVMAKVISHGRKVGSAQFKLERLAAVVSGQPFIVRLYSPSRLLGGGRVTVPVAEERSKAPELLDVTTMSIEDAALAVVGSSSSGVSTEQVCRQVGRTPQTLGDVLELLLHSGKIVGFGGHWITPSHLTEKTAQIQERLESLHNESPTVVSFSRDAVFHHLGVRWGQKALDRLLTNLVDRGLIRSSASGIGLTARSLQLSPSQRALIDKVKSELAKSGINVPPPKDLAAVLHVPVQAVDGILRMGLETGEIVRIDDSIWYSRDQLDLLVQSAKVKFGEARFTAAEFRDFVGTSRKYAIPLLEFFDSKRITFRQGDSRIFVHMS